MMIVGIMTMLIVVLQITEKTINSRNREKNEKI